MYSNDKFHAEVDQHLLADLRCIVFAYLLRPCTLEQVLHTTYQPSLDVYFSDDVASTLPHWKHAYRRWMTCYDDGYPLLDSLCYFRLISAMDEVSIYHLQCQFFYGLDFQGFGTLPTQVTLLFTGTPRIYHLQKGSIGYQLIDTLTKVPLFILPSLAPSTGCQIEFDSALPKTLRVYALGGYIKSGYDQFKWKRFTDCLYHRVTYYYGSLLFHDNSLFC